MARSPLIPFRPAVCAALACSVLSTPARGEPRASITAPNAGACTCPSATIAVQGASFDSLPSEYQGDRLEYATNPGAGPWTTIGTSTTPVPTPGALYFWNTAGLPAGTYYLRLTVTGACASTAALTHVTIRPATLAAPALSIADSASPGTTSFVGAACITAQKVIGCDQTLTPVLEFRIVGTTPWTSLATTDRGLLVEGVLEAPDTGPTGVSTDYEVRARVQDVCGAEASSQRTISLWSDPDPPAQVVIDAGACAGYLSGVRTITGTVNVPALRSWLLTYHSATDPTPRPLGAGASPINAGTLAVWDTRLVPACAYTLTLQVESRNLVGCGGSLLTHATTRAVNVGCPADFNRSGFTSVQDVFDYLDAFFSVCP